MGTGRQRSWDGAAKRGDENKTFDNGQVLDENWQAPQEARRHVFWVNAQILELAHERDRPFVRELKEAQAFWHGVDVICNGKPCSVTRTCCEREQREVW